METTVTSNHQLIEGRLGKEETGSAEVSALTFDLFVRENYVAPCSVGKSRDLMI